ncbi:LOW QUALITY PROTEIN: tryptophan synthase alpha chain [Bacillus sp. JCM 19046]|nr:LOW QUALITY PROTEIN: tryptophan synthase alpha chain [Bacillus sp. JCM 19046]
MSERLRKAVTKEKLFIPFITAGDPTIEATIELALSLERAGADVIELGIPYSDPLADGQVIQAASKRALTAGMTFAKALELVSKLRERGLNAPVILFTYANPLLQYGFTQFVNEASAFGVDGILVPDLPFEESEEFGDICAKEDLALISLVAPTSKERVEKIASSAKGFLYCVSSLGVTGTRNELHPDLKQFLQVVKISASIPCVVGFGVSQADQVEEINRYADGVVVGSAIVKQIGSLTNELIQPESRSAAVAKVEAFVKQLHQPVASG